MLVWVLSYGCLVMCVLLVVFIDLSLVSDVYVVVCSFLLCLIRDSFHFVCLFSHVCWFVVL